MLKGIGYILLEKIHDLKLRSLQYLDYNKKNLIVF